MDPLPTNGVPSIIDTIDVLDGWNMIGSVADSVNVRDIQSIPPGIATSQFFGYNGAYYTSSTIDPGKGYWAKVKQPGQLILASGASVNGMSTIRIEPTLELPPGPPETVIGNPQSVVPSAFSLGQNYPNPFNPKTDFRFQIPDWGLVTLRVYDVLGREMATIVNEELPSGIYRRTWDASRMASGVYFYRLTSGTFSDTRKLLLMK
jgi:hypothetical protein